MEGNITTQQNLEQMVGFSAGWIESDGLSKGETRSIVSLGA